MNNYSTEELLKYFREESLSNEQSQKYIDDISATVMEFFAVMQIGSLNDIENIDKIRGIVDYKNYMMEKKNSEQTRNQKLIRVRAFFKYLYHKGLISKNILEGEKVKVPQKIEDDEIVFTMEDLSRVIISAKDEQHFVVRLTFAASGIRYCELSNLKVKDVKDGVLLVHGKGKKDRYVQVFKSLTDTLFDFIRHENLDQNDYVFHADTGGKISGGNINKTMKTAAKKLGIANYEKLSEHDFRHAYSTILWEKFNVPMTIIAKNLGHKQGEKDVPKVTLLYARTTPEHVRKYIDNICILDFFAIDGKQINMRTRYKERYCKGE